ncbi:MAG: proprotein convertase P-domain-containing protein [bacterium]
MRRCFWVCFLILPVINPQPLSAAPKLAEGAERAIESLQKASEKPWETVWSGDRIRWLIGGHLVLGTTDPVEAGQRFLASHGSVAGLSDPATEMRLRGVKQGKAFTRLDYDQMYDGRRVVDGRLVLTVDKAGALRSLHSSVRVPNAAFRTPRSTIRTTAPQITSDDAVRAVSEELSIGSLRGPLSQELAVLIERGQPREVWEVRVPSAEPLGDFVILVDATTGDLIRKRNFLCHLDGIGRVFDPNPVVTLQNPYLDDDWDSSEAIPESGYRTVTLRDIDPSGILWGPYVNVRGSSDRAREPGLQFLYSRSDGRFEQVMAYFHIDRNHRYLNGLGYEFIANYCISVETNAHSEDQSFYSPFLRQITFGSGGVDDAEDADIILHEYGHAIQHDEIPEFGTTQETQAMGEGFADYWAFSNDADGTFNPEIIADWDSTVYSTEDPPCLRRVDRDFRYPEDMIFDVHEDGQIWSRALHDLWERLGKTIADTLVIESHFALNSDASFFDGAQAIYEADRVLYDGAHSDDIFEVFDDRGLAATTLSEVQLTVVAGESVKVPFTQSVLGGPVTLRWEQIAGPPAENRIVTADQLYFVAPDPPNGALMTDVVFRLYAERDNRVVSYTDLTVTVLGPSVLFDSPEDGVRIPDNREQGIARIFEYNDSGPVSHIVLYVDVEHSYRGDLEVELTSPSGTTATLVQSSSKPGKGLELILFASETTANTDALKVFVGEEAHGIWSLTISDVAAADTGSLLRWALGIQTVGSQKPVSIPIDLRNGSVLYREDFERNNLSETGFVVYPGGFDGSLGAGKARLDKSTWIDHESQDGSCLVLSAAPGEVITVALDPSRAIPSPGEVFLSVRVSSSSGGATIAIALLEQSFDGSIGLLSPIDSASFTDSWSTLHTYFSPASGGVLPVLQVANRTGTGEISVLFDDLTIYPVQVTPDQR